MKGKRRLFSVAPFRKKLSDAPGQVGPVLYDLPFSEIVGTNETKIANAPRSEITGDRHGLMCEKWNIDNNTR